MILRPYQAQAVADIGAAFDQGARSVLYVLPTGGGKTPVMARICQLCHEHGTSSAILTHRDTLLHQAAGKLRAVGVPHSLISPGRTNFGDSIQVASVQTLARRLGRYSFDLLDVDEAHHAVSPTYSRIFAAWPDARILGVTATPARPDGRGLGEVFERMVVGPSVRHLMDDGWLTEADSYGPAKPVDASGLRSRGGDYAAEDVERIMDRREITGDAVEHYRALCPGAPALAFCATVAHAQHVAGQFRAAGYRFEAVDGAMPRGVLAERLGALASGALDGLASCDLVSEGFDAPGVSAIIMLRQTKSEVVYLQQVGRGLRPSVPVDPLPDRAARLAAMAASRKPRAIILDHVGNAFRHGLADDAREWTLEARKRGAQAPPVKPCPRCYAYCRASDRACRTCGHVFVVVAREEVMPGTVAGKLSKIDAAALRRLRLAEESAALTYQQLVELGRRRGYGVKWAYHRWLARGGDPALAR